MAERLLSPLTFHGTKLAVLMKNSPTVAMRASGMNFVTVVQTWTEPIVRTPVRLIAAGTQSPMSAIAIDQRTWPLRLRKCST